MQCDGSGYCLTVKLICNFNCKPKKCPNYIICNNKVPWFILEFNKGVCNECITRVGTCLENPTLSNPVLEFTQHILEPIECPVCFQSFNEGVKNPRCSHVTCISCLKAIYWYEDNLFSELRPVFPEESGKEEDYLLEPNLYINDQLVNEWKRQLGSWNEFRINFVLNNKKYLKRCPLCRR